MKLDVLIILYPENKYRANNYLFVILAITWEIFVKFTRTNSIKIPLIFHRIKIEQPTKIENLTK